MGDLDVQDLDAADAQLLGNEHAKRLSQSEPTKTQLNSHLPQTGGAEPFVVRVIFNQCPSIPTQSRAAYDEPQKAVRFQYEAHGV